MVIICSVTTRLLKVPYSCCGDPGGKPVVLVHGCPDNARGWQPVAEALAARGFYSLIPYFMHCEQPQTAAEAFLALKESLRPAVSLLPL